MGARMKETLSELGGRGGGSKDIAQGGVLTPDGIEAALAETTRSIGP